MPSHPYLFLRSHFVLIFYVPLQRLYQIEKLGSSTPVEDADGSLAEQKTRLLKSRVCQQMTEQQ